MKSHSEHHNLSVHERKRPTVDSDSDPLKLDELHLLNEVKLEEYNVNHDIPDNHDFFGDNEVISVLPVKVKQKKGRPRKIKHFQTKPENQ